jgi:hypothetical protein
MTERRATPAVEPERGPSLLINGFLGGVVAVLLAFLPFSPVLGGSVAGYLQGPDRRAGLRAGALAGAVSLVPLLLISFLVAGFLVIVPATPGGPGPRFPLFLAVVVLTGLAVLGIYTVGGGALGGYVGSYIKEDRLRNAEVKAGGTREAGTPTEPETSGEQET